MKSHLRLSPQDKLIRLTFARMHLTGDNEWKNVIFKDEKKLIRMALILIIQIALKNFWTEKKYSKWHVFLKAEL